MTTLHREPQGVIAFTKGAPEQVLQQCREALTADGPAPLDARQVLTEADRLAAEGYRVLGFACRAWPAMPDTPDAATVERGLSLLGLVALMDPPRPEAAEAVDQCKTAGIAPVMITGDHAATALTTAKRLGIADDRDPVMDGEELDRLSDEEFESRVDQLRVYARVDPEQKIKIVRALQDRGEYVAMTGDGVNDAPALKHADIGVAMGLKGTDVAREAADMVLLDDNFATIVGAVREGRRIYDNVRKFVKYTMTSNSGELWTLFLAPFAGLPIPLLPIHILWINLVTDGLPGLALAVEPEERGIMKRPPRPPQESIFAHGMWQHMVWVGLLIGGLTVLAQALAIHSGSPNWQTIVFTVLTLSQLAHALAIRSEADSLFTIGIQSNMALLGAVLLTVLLQLATIYVPFLQPIFKTQGTRCIAGSAAFSRYSLRAPATGPFVRVSADPTRPGYVEIGHVTRPRSFARWVAPLLFPSAIGARTAEQIAMETMIYFRPKIDSTRALEQALADRRPVRAFGGTPLTRNCSINCCGLPRASPARRGFAPRYQPRRASPGVARPGRVG
jgi:Ca2+-transporting ATPase